MAVSQLLFPTHLKTCVDKWEERHHIRLLPLPFVRTSRDQFEEELHISEAKRREYRRAVRRRDELIVQTGDKGAAFCVSQRHSCTCMSSVLTQFFLLCSKSYSDG